MKKRIKCCCAGCNTCKKRKTVEKDSTGTELYTCKINSNKHEIVYGNECKKFRCNDSSCPFYRKCTRKCK